MATEAAARAFFTAPYFAVVGASSDPTKFGHKIFTWYIQHGIAATPINPSAPSIKAYPAWPAAEMETYPTLPNLGALPHPTETSVSIITPPKVTLKVLEEAKKLGIRGVWLQPGTFDDETLKFAFNEFEAAVGGDGGRGSEGWCILVDGEAMAMAAGKELKFCHSIDWPTEIERSRAAGDHQDLWISTSVFFISLPPTPEMPPNCPAKQFTGNGIRRRPTTACLTCRSRRVKCNRERPVCTPCAKGKRGCKYLSSNTTIEFIADTLSKDFEITRAESPPDTSVSSVDGGSWASLLRSQVEHVHKYDPREVRDEVKLWTLTETTGNPSKSKQPHAPIYIQISALGSQFWSNLNTQLPPRACCDCFFDHFVSSVHPLIPICHLSTVKTIYAEFWDSLSPSYSVETLILILSTLYTGAANSFPAHTHYALTLKILYDQIFTQIDLPSYHIRSVSTPHSLQILQGYVIMNTFIANTLAPFSAYGFLSQAIRFAQSLRLHIEQDHKSFANTVESQMGREIWYHLVFLDVESTIASGLQGIIHHHGYTTTLPPLPFLDEKGVKRDNLVEPIVIAMQGQWHWAIRMQRWFERMPEQTEVIAFKSLIEDLMKLIPEGEQNEWSRTYLRMQIDRAYCMLGLRFWQLDDFNGTSCHSEVVKTAGSFLDSYLFLSTHQSPQYKWYLPGLIQPIHALLICLMHLSSCPNLSSDVRTRELIDQIFQIRINHIKSGSIISEKSMLRINPHSDEAPGSNARYHALIILYNKVWAKNGWAVGCGVRPSPGIDIGSGVAEGIAGAHWEGLDDNNTHLNHISEDDSLQWEEWENIAAGFFPL
ncbi:hypothetical protein B7494_g5259 [Chlorociboria aeruginascens]|nr:hypothetical protein B7494_g5259 [Chlorociboria aeruginascens]